jgi:hypothetical protein
VFNKSYTQRRSAFLALVFLSFYVTAIQWYTHVETYPLSALVGRNEFDTYGAFYEGRLVFALYIPYFALLVVNAWLWFRRPQVIALWPLVVTFVLNLSIMIVSFTLAVPLHQQHHAQGGFITPDQMKALLNVNALRLGASVLSSALVMWMLVRVLHQNSVGSSAPNNTSDIASKDPARAI